MAHLDNSILPVDDLLAIAIANVKSLCYALKRAKYAYPSETPFIDPILDQLGACEFNFDLYGSALNKGWRYLQNPERQWLLASPSGDRDRAKELGQILIATMREMVRSSPDASMSDWLVEASSFVLEAVQLGDIGWLEYFQRITLARCYEFVSRFQAA
jgi:hypothetical protein